MIGDGIAMVGIFSISFQHGVGQMAVKPMSFI
jgi:hypothetical protein